MIRLRLKVFCTTYQFKTIVLSVLLCLIGLNLNAQLDSIALFEQEAKLGRLYDAKSDTAWRNIDSCLHYSFKAIPLLKKTNQWDMYIASLNGLNYCYETKEAYDSMEKYSKQAYTEAQIYLIPENENYVGALNNRARCFYKIKKDYRRALKFYKEAYRLAQTIEMRLVSVATIETNIGEMYYCLGDFDTALLYYNLAADNFENSIVEGEKGAPFKEAKVLDKIAQLHFQLKDYCLAKTFQLKSIEKIHATASPDDELDPSFLIRFQTRLATIQWYVGEEQAFDEQIDSLLQITNLTILQKSNLYYLKGIALVEQRKYVPAIAKYKKALSFALKEGENNAVKIHQALAQTYTLQNLLRKALVELQKGIQILCPSTKLANELVTPSLQEQVFAPLELGRLLRDKGNVLMQQYYQTKEAAYLEAAINNYMCLVDLTTQIRGTYQSEEAQLYLLEETRADYEKAIEVCYLLFEHQKTDDLLDQAFFFVEKSKSNLLLDELQRKNAQAQFVHEEALVNKEYELRKKINFIQKELQAIDLKDVEQQELNADLLRLRQKLQNERETISEKYPIYAKLSSQQPVSVQQLQMQFKEDETVFSYFFGAKNIYVFKISKYEKTWLQLSNKLEIEKVLASFCTIENLKLVGTSAYERYIEKGYFLYEQLIKSLGTPAPNSTLIIIPDGQLENLPFDILVAQKIKVDFPKEIPFLVKHYTISSIYSASILAEQSNSKVATSQLNILRVFPVFENTPQYLPYNAKIKKILEQLKGLTLLKSDATKESFMQVAADYDIIHLSTHAHTSNALHKQPAIQFADGEMKLSDFQSLRLKAQLAILSACETNAGRYRDGEGIMSLARVFTYTGISSVITSMTNIKEKSTSQIMGFLYANLEAGQTKNKALQLAKLRYLENCTNAESAPYYWGTLLAIGNMDSISFAYKRNYEQYLLIIAFGLLALFFFKNTKMERLYNAKKT